MGANAQTTVPTFTAAQVLTADQMNQSARTGVPVFADATARDAGFGGTGEKVLAEGQLCYLESTNVVQYYDGSVWATVGPQTLSSGLNYITGASFTAASTVSLPNDTFTATYDNYRIIMDVTDISATQTISARMRAAGADDTTANYQTTSLGIDTTGVARNLFGNALTSFLFGGVLDGVAFQDYYSFSIDVIAPKLGRFTEILGTLNWSGATWFAGNYYAANFSATTSFDAMSWIVAGGANITGNYRVYGYANS